MNKKPVDSAVWEWRAQTDKLCLAQIWKTEFHVSVIVWLMLLAASLVMRTCSWESVGFDIFTVGVCSYRVPLCRNADGDGWVSAAPMYPRVPGKSFYTAAGIFAKGLFRLISHVPSGNVFQREEVIIVKEPSGSSAPGLCPCLCEGWRGSATVGTRVPRHGSWTGPGSSQLPFSSSSTGIEGLLKRSTEVHGLEVKKEHCSK